MMANVTHDLPTQITYRRENAPYDTLSLQLGKPDLDSVEPRKSRLAYSVHERSGDR